MATVFDVTAPMAMFRKPYTTTSSVSYAFPPPTAVAGLISAISGISNGSDKSGCGAQYWKSLSGTSIAVGIRGKVSWMSQALNMWNVKNPGKNAHIQVKHQFVARPRYRIYVSGGIEDRLDGYLKRGAFVYTPYLGTSYALADLEYVGRFGSASPDGGPLALDTIVPWTDGMTVDVLSSGGAFKERVPLQFDVGRGLVKACSVIYSPAGDGKVVVKERGELDVSLCGEDLVAWFPAW